MKDTPDSPGAPNALPAGGASADEPKRLMFGFASRSWKNAGREGLWVVSSQITTSVAALAGVRLITELATREVVGQASILLGVFMLARNIFLAPVGNAQLRFHPDYVASGQVAWFTGRMMRLTWLGAAGLALTLATALVAWKVIDSRVPLAALLGLALVLTCIEVPRCVRANRLNADRMRGASALWSSSEACFTVLCTAAALMLCSSRESYLSGQALGLLLSLGLFGMLFYPNVPPDSSAPPPEGERRLKELVVRYGLPFIPLALVGWVSNLGDRYIVGGYLGSADVGIYTVAYGLASRPFLIVGGVLSEFARPILFQAEGQGNHSKVKRVLALWFVIAAGVSALGLVGFWFLGDRLAGILLAEPFRHRDTTAVLVWVGAAYSCLNGIQILEVRLMSLGTSRKLVAPALAGAAANVAMNILLVPRLGIVGAAQATAAAFLLQALLMGWICAGARSSQTAGRPDRNDRGTDQESGDGRSGSRTT